MGKLKITVSFPETGESKSQYLTFVPTKKATVEKIELITPLDNGFDNEQNSKSDGILLGKSYKLRVKKFKDDIEPKSDDEIKWGFSYISNKGESVVGAFKSKGREVVFTANTIEACGTEITFYCYIEDKDKEAQLAVSHHNLFHGTFLWTETKGTGHTFLSVHNQNEIILFTYGRYDDADWIPITGEGVLIRFTNTLAIEYMHKELFRLNAKAFKICDVKGAKVAKIYTKIWNSSKELPDSGKEKTDKYGRVIDKYDLTGNNCTTESIEILEKAGTQIFKQHWIKLFGTEIGEYNEDFVIPSSLENYLLEEEGDTIKNYTEQFRTVFSTDAFSELKSAGLMNESSGFSGDSSGSSANSSSMENTSSGSSPASSGGSVGSSSNK